MFRNYTTFSYDRDNCSSNAEIAACSPQKWYLTILSAAQITACVFAIILMLVLRYAASSRMVIHRNARVGYFIDYVRRNVTIS